MNHLRTCTIEDFGLIASARVAFSDGLTAFSGETGSGKTMLLGALRFALGERAATDQVRAGAERARVTLEFEVDDELRARLLADGFEIDPDENTIVTRELMANGRTAGRLNGRPATGAQLRLLAEALVEVVGQHEAQRLLAPAYQTELLDRFAGAPALVALGAVAAHYARANALSSELRALEESEGRALADVEDARFALREIDAAQLTVDEESGLRERRDYLANTERIALGLATAYEALASEQSGAGDALASAASSLAGIAGYGASLRELAERLGAAQSDVAELAGALLREREATEFDAGESERLGARIDAIERLKRKYGGSVAQVLLERERRAALLERFEGFDARLAAVRDDLAATRRALEREAARLSQLRADAAGEIAARVANELAGLAMPAARFEVALQQIEIGARGAERIEFMLSPNAGEPARVLARAASGGELSRVLLALVVVLADRRDPPALVFDEIDAGIGGATAAAVGVRLGALAERGQVFCVTHLAQIASWADVHYALRKSEQRGATRIEVVELATQSAVGEEIARMLSGSGKRVALEHARALLQEVAAQRKAPG